MKSKIICIFILTMLVITAGKIYGQDIPRYYICFDNSASMKQFEFYPRILGGLFALLKSEERIKDFALYYVPFGANSNITILDKYENFTSYIDKNTAATTNFVKLADVLENIDDNDHFIIISDGEHDTSNKASFSYLTAQELGQMKNVIQRLKSKRRHFHSIHILKKYGHIESFEDINRYYRGLSGNTRNRLRGVPEAVQEGGIIASLTKDFMRKLAGDESRYFSCKDNQGALNALMKIFKVTQTFSCNSENFKTAVPVELSFEYVDPVDQEWFRKEIEKTTFCLPSEGFQRSIVIKKNKDFKLKIVYENNYVYNLYIGDEPIWENDTIQYNEDLKRCIKHHIVKELKEMIFEKIDKEPEFTPPQCLLSIQVTDKNLYGFLAEKNFRIFRKSCGSSDWTPIHAAYFFPEEKRIYIHIPTLIAESIRITLPVDKNNPDYGKNIILELDKTGMWNNDEWKVGYQQLTYPVIKYDFSQFFQKYPGTLLFFSKDTNRFIDRADHKDNTKINIFKGQFFNIYYVPADIESNIIKSVKRELKTTSDFKIILDLLAPADNERNFKNWRECLDSFAKACEMDRPAKNVKSKSTQTSTANKDIVTRQIAISNGLIHLLSHLSDVKQEKKMDIFVKLLNSLINLYKDTSFPFTGIKLLNSEIPVFSEQLWNRFLVIGDRAKIDIILLLLAEPIKNLSELRDFINGKFENVSPDNHNYFKQLED
jgi:hypothetical protein